MSFPSFFRAAGWAALVVFAADCAQAQSLPLSAAQSQSLGLRFAPAAAAAELDATGNARVVLRPDAQYVVAAPYPGMVPRVLVALGQPVRAGQPLASFASPQLYEAVRALAEARSQATLAGQVLARDRSLHEDGIIAASRLQSSQARAGEAAAMVRAREAEMAAAGVAMAPRGGEAQLVAGRAGMIAEVNAVPGVRVDAAAPLFRIVDPTALELELLLGRDMPAPRGGERVEVRARGARGSVAGVVPAGDGTGAVRVRVVLEQRGDLQAGESVAATLRLRGAGGGAGSAEGGRVRVPAAALTYWQNRPGVFVQSKEGARFVPVTVESTDDATATVRGALPPGARVAVAGIAALKGMLGGGQ
ncbi:efflux transporter periplasmic adaptor subunit [Cupriavidus sp. USMAA2-4]|uniref:efflux RND transporter periplasmic adaptor subunit n=1 Tax=Cupriavidus sp. USMAA2-4 TaxID=876364 RepID=UPI0008A6E02C|nr:efflux RND transporter periplasmic adaptor subunit [Cupriavidus sp. USMAA2-4]AOY96520.1 efflux transporter periplasmic adaptor subunit [Cupriavidus sp. USMAA2-4]